MCTAKFSLRIGSVKLPSCNWNFSECALLKRALKSTRRVKWHRWTRKYDYNYHETPSDTGGLHYIPETTAVRICLNLWIRLYSTWFWKINFTETKKKFKLIETFLISLVLPNFNINWLFKKIFQINMKQFYIFRPPPPPLLNVFKKAAEKLSEIHSNIVTTQLAC